MVQPGKVVQPGMEEAWLQADRTRRPMRFRVVPSGRGLLERSERRSPALTEGARRSRWM